MNENMISSSKVFVIIGTLIHRNIVKSLKSVYCQGE